MNVVVRALLIPVLLSLGACAANTYCMGEQPYQKATSVPPLRPAGDLKLPESPAALRIPPPPATPVPYGQTVKDKDGDDAIRCLDKPPEMAIAPEAPPEPPPVAPAPAPVAEPAPAEQPASEPKG